MTTTPDWPSYLRRITNGESGAQISRTTGIPASTISRWLSGETKPSWEKVDALAKHYQFDVQEALGVVAAFHPNQHRGSSGTKLLRNPFGNDALSLSPDTSRLDVLRCYTDLELAEEFVRRIEHQDSVITQRPLPYAEQRSNIIPLTPNVDDTAEDDHLDAVARPRDPEPTDEQ